MTLSPETPHREIPLSQGQVAIVDAADYDWLNQWKWYARWNPHTKGFYAQRNSIGIDGKSYQIQMHRLILGLEKGNPIQGDHVSCNSLDNRRLNLRAATIFQQQFNRRRRKDNASGYKGVTQTPKSSTWMACIMVNRKSIYLGTRRTKEEAYALYCDAADKYHGEFGRKS